MKRNEDSLETSETTLNTSAFTLWGPKKEKRETKDLKIFEALIAENFLKARESKQSTKLEKYSVPGRRILLNT